MCNQVGTCVSTAHRHRRWRFVPTLCGVLLVALGSLAANAQPEAPTSLRAIAGDEEVRLRWDNPQDPAITRYEFRFGAGATPAFNAWADVPASGRHTDAHTVAGLVNGTRYTFDVRAATEEGVGAAARTSITLAMSPATAVEMPDAQLRGLVRDMLALAGDAAFTQADLAKLTVLYGSQAQIADLTGLEHAVNLDQLVLSGNAITDVAALSRLTALTVLDLRDNAISDVAPLSALTSLEALHLSDNDVSDVAGLSGLTSLVALELSDNEISDMAPLSSLVALVQLHLAGNAITDVSALSQLTALVDLDMSSNTIANISALSALTSLRSVSLSGNVIADVSALAGLTALDGLFLQGNVISDVAALKGLAALTALNLADNNISDPSALSALTSLWLLDLSANAISDVAALSALTTLADLNLADNNISDPSALSGLASVAYLNLSGNAISDVSALSGLASAWSLDLSGNAITDVSGLSGLSALGALYLSNNDIADASPLSGLPVLGVLYLPGNNIRELPDLSGLTALRGLYLSNNRISDISAISDVPTLRTLRLDGNAVADVSALRDLTLANLNLQDNAVADISPLAEIEFLEEGYVDLRGNPLPTSAADHVGALRERRVIVVYDDGGHRLPLFPSPPSAPSEAGSPAQGFVRVINHSDEAGSVSIEAVDEAGERYGPVSLAINAGQARHFNVGDLERGSSAKGLSGVGEGAGDWRLILRSELDIEVLGYARTPDGFVTSLHDLAAEAYEVSRVPTFNPGSNRRQVSRLRLTNPTSVEGFARFSAIDDKGTSRDGGIAVAAGQTVEVAADRLESGEAIEHFPGFGDGAGKWRLSVFAPGQRVTSLLESPTGHLANISTGAAVSAADVRTHAAWRQGGRYRVPLFLAQSSDIQGFLRVINLSYARTTVTVRAFDDDGVERQAATLTLRGGETLHFNSRHFEQGDAGRGLPGIGAGTGDWHLDVRGNRRFEVLAYARTADGFVTSLHDTAPRLANGDFWIPFFNPGRNRNQESRLRLVNWGETAGEATITAVDDAGRSAGESVRVTIPAHAARDYTAWQLEAGEGPGLMSGALGAGSGKWRLRVATTGDVQAMSLLSLPTGHVTNLSTTPRHPRE